MQSEKKQWIDSAWLEVKLYFVVVFLLGQLSVNNGIMKMSKFLGGAGTRYTIA
jgi:hypothetical protein